jgi:holo-[acyl-carrier protein] synthase
VGVRVGVDLVAVASVREAVDRHADRYLERIFTPQEIADSRSSNGLDVERLAARFAAKEAMLKVLRPHETPVPWQTIRVRRCPGGWVELELDGAAARLATEAGIVELALSLTHEGPLACAVVVAELR